MCGIFGIINKNKKTLDSSTFNVLGVENDSRGGDSCGIFIDGKVEYGVNDKKLYNNFFRTSELLKSSLKCNIALGHCRKASVGAINKQNAQPVVIKDSNDNIAFVLIHNGTIVNYKELAAQYIPEIDITNMTDSQVMAHIFYYSGYDVLEKYIGAGAFVMVDYREEEPYVFLFKGESKLYTYSAQTATERPLYCSYNDKEFIFSSLSTYLKALRPNNKVYSVRANTLIWLDGATPVIIEEYDRKDCYQIQSKAVKSYSPYEAYYDNYYDDYYDSSYNSNNYIGCIFCDDDLIFRCAGNTCHGRYFISKYGGTYTNKVNKSVEEFWFYEGVLLKNRDCYSFLIELQQDFKCGSAALAATLPEILIYLSAYPVKYNDDFNTPLNPTNYTAFSGNIIIPFTYKQLKIESGKIVGKTFVQEKQDVCELIKSLNKTKIDKNKLKLEIYEGY